MEILKVERDKTGFHKVSFIHNNMKAYYYLEYSFNSEFMKELQEFQKLFFSNECIDWIEVYNDDDILSFFVSNNFIFNDDLMQEAYNKGIRGF